MLEEEAWFDEVGPEEELGVLVGWTVCGEDGERKGREGKLTSPPRLKIEIDGKERGLASKRGEKEERKERKLTFGRPPSLKPDLLSTSENSLDELLDIFDRRSPLVADTEVEQERVHQTLIPLRVRRRDWLSFEVVQDIVFDQSPCSHHRPSILRIDLLPLLDPVDELGWIGVEELSFGLGFGGSLPRFVHEGRARGRRRRWCWFLRGKE